NRIVLRKIEKSDAHDICQYYSNENVYRYLDWNGPESIEKCGEIIDRWNKDYAKGWIIRFAIVDKETEKVIGTIFLNDFRENRAEIGYELSEAYWRKGFMSEAMREVLKLAFHKFDLSRIQAFVHKENESSIGLLKKFNFKKEGYLRQYEYHSVTGECADMFIFSLLKTEFYA
ncbi:MAG TPA: GNAT family protein, partial [Spirochaetota bacterium]